MVKDFGVKSGGYTTKTCGFTKLKTKLVFIVAKLRWLGRTRDTSLKTGAFFYLKYPLSLNL